MAQSLDANDPVSSEAEAPGQLPLPEFIPAALRPTSDDQFGYEVTVV